MKIVEFLPSKLFERIVFHISENKESDNIMAFTEINEDSFHVMCKRMPKKHVHGIAEQKAFLKSGEEEDRNRNVFDDQQQQFFWELQGMTEALQIFLKS
mgnify:CR=1 FL=1